MPHPATRDYQVTLNDGPDANGMAGVVASLLEQNLEQFPARVRLARKLARPVTITGSDIDSTCTISCSPYDLTISNDVVGSPSVSVTATVDQILDLSQLKMRAGGLLPIGFFTRRGLRLLAAIAVGRLTVRGLITHPVTALRVIALLSVES
ncbi:MAG TPA: hypothetical protein VLI04_22715 [Nocardioidaceae bacterium]|nr:hypothetical protein [Nocardioidaceae bacterium]